MDLIRIRRNLIAAQPTLPHNYQQVKYLFRSSNAGGPVAILNFQMEIGDKLMAKIKAIDLSGERAFGGQNGKVELYYQNNSKILKSWSSGSQLSWTNSYGDEYDMLFCTCGQAFPLLTWGYYRSTNYLFNGNMFELLITDSNDVSKLHLLPCYRKTDSEPGWYDIVTGIFYPNNATTGAWVPGPNV